MNAPYKCTKCGRAIWEFQEDNYAGSDIIVCPKCGCRKILDTRTNKQYRNTYNLPGTWT